MKKRQRLYIIPNRYGLAFGAMLSFMILAAAIYNNNLIYILGFLAATLAIASAVQTNVNLLGMELTNSHIEPGFADEKLFLELTIKNKSRQTRHFLEANIRIPKIESETIAIDEIGSQQQKIIRIGFTPKSRGHFKIEGIQLHTTYALGLFWAWMPIKINAEAIVYPARKNLIPLPPPNKITADGTTSSAKLGDDFSGHRNYRHGDSVRHIDWKVLSRSGNTLLKEFHDGGQALYFLKWSDVSNLAFEDSLSQFAFWIDELGRRKTPFGCESPYISFQNSDDSELKTKLLASLAIALPPGSPR